MLNKVVSEIIKNLNKKEEINKLGCLVRKMENIILNDKEIYDKTVKNPFKYIRPIKGKQSFKTHNFILNECFTKGLNHVKIIISCDSFCNEENKNNFDSALFVNNVNIVDKLQNNYKNMSKCYRITSCGIKIKAKLIKYEFKKLMNLQNTLYSSVLKYDPFYLYYFDGSNKTKSINNGEIDINNLNVKYNLGIFNLNEINNEFKDIKQVDKEGIYFICECENFDFLQIIKHVEHIPLQEYEEILNIDINENVW